MYACCCMLRKCYASFQQTCDGVRQLANTTRVSIQLTDMKRTPGSYRTQRVATQHTFLTWKSIGWVSVRGLCCGMLSTQPVPTLQNSGGMYKSSYRLLTSGMVLTRVLGGNLGASHLYRPACRGGEWGDRERERDLERDREERLWTFAGERDRPRLGGGLRGLQYQHIHKSCNIYTTLDAFLCCFCCHGSQ